MKRECARTGINYNTTGIYTKDVTMPFGKTLTRSEYIGYAIWANALSDEVLNELVTATASTGKPVAIIDEMGSVRGRLVGNSITKQSVINLYKNQ